ncbi:MAG: MBL fold metallo-hydrolase [Acetobacteraceae bacterium]|nr:MBL fold metallo-hydrolase [Acetobacteraceae bacterium]
MTLRAAVIPVTPFQQNCAILWDEADRRGLVVDPGGEADRVLQAVDQLGVAVERILLTHGHLDHAGGGAELQASLRACTGDSASVPVEGPDRRDAFLLEGIEAQARAYGLEGMRGVAPDRWLAEGETVRLGAHVFEVLHCPGHTPGHVVFVNRAASFAILGDVLFQGSIGRTDFPYGDQAALIRSIREKVLPLGDDVAFLCGHGPGSTIGAERRANPFLRGA